MKCQHGLFTGKHRLVEAGQPDLTSHRPQDSAHPPQRKLITPTPPRPQHHNCQSLIHLMAMLARFVNQQVPPPYAPYRPIATMPDFSKEITIIINEDIDERAASFKVPEDMLTEHSDYFKAACRKTWKEGSSRIFRLDDIGPDAFDHYLYWVHREKLHVASAIFDLDAGGPTGMRPDQDTLASLFSTLVKLWLLADRLADTLLRNTVTDALREVMQHAREPGFWPTSCRLL